MATTDNNLQVINSMTESQLDSLKDSNGKIPDLANQLVMTDDENSENYYTAGNGISITNGVISGVSIEQIWINDRANVSNSSRDITLTSSDYDFLLFVYGSYYVNLEYEMSVICKKGNNSTMNSHINYSSSPYVGIVTRTMFYVNDTTYNIGNCSVSNASGTRTDNERNIPKYIYGIKVV